MKKISSFIIVFLLFSVVVLPAFAQVDKKDEMKMMKEEKQQDRMAKKVGTLQQRADREINRRIASLQKLLDRLNDLKRLSADQKESFAQQIQTEMDNLMTLQTKIKGNTDPETLKTDVQSIVSSYRVYALFIPQLTLLSMADRMDTTTDNLTSLATKLQGRIDKASSEGKNVADLQSALVDMKKKIADAKTQEQNAITAVTPLTPEGYPENKKILENARMMLQKAHQSLVSAREDARKIMKGLGIMTEEKQQSATTPSSSL